MGNILDDSTRFLDKTGLRLLKSNPSLGLGFTLLTQVTPTVEGRIADFEDLAESSQGAKKLAVLRMDVDNLGNLFARGLGDRATASRVASLSFLLRLFFEGYLGQICSAEVSRLYAIYSGGDDLFVVGSWDAIPKVAAMIRDEFAEFCCRNPDVTISAGIAIQDCGFPLYQFAELAKESLDGRAKQRKEAGRVVKNAVDFLGCTLSWEGFRQAETRMSELRDWIKTEKCPNAILHLLLRLYRRYLQELEEAETKRRLPAEGQVLYGRWMWLTQYSLSRMAERVEDNEVKNGIRSLQRDLLTPGYLQKAALAARWTELLVRERRQS